MLRTQNRRQARSPRADTGRVASWRRLASLNELGAAAGGLLKERKQTLAGLGILRGRADQRRGSSACPGRIGYYLGRLRDLHRGDRSFLRSRRKTWPACAQASSGYATIVARRVREKLGGDLGLERRPAPPVRRKSLRATPPATRAGSQRAHREGGSPSRPGSAERRGHMWTFATRAAGGCCNSLPCASPCPTISAARRTARRGRRDAAVHREHQQHSRISPGVAPLAERAAHVHRELGGPVDRRHRSP